MRNISRVIGFIILFNIYVYSVEVAEEELRKVGKVVFENYSKPFKGVSTEYLYSVGLSLSEISIEDKVRSYGNYSIIRVLPKEGLYGADIIFISRNSKIRHINAIRYVISGYLSQKYGFSKKDAYTLAVLITYYNAIYRGNIQYFKSKYVQGIFSFTSKDIGISTKYYDWPGRTELVIPTREGVFGNKVKIGEIANENITEKLTTNEEVEKTKEKILEIRKKEVEKEKEEIKQKEKELQEKREEIGKKKEEIKKMEEEVGKNGDKQKLLKIEEEKKQLEKEEKKITEEEKKVEKVKEEVSKEEEEIKKQEKEVKNEKKVSTKSEDKNLTEKEKELEEKEKELEKKEKELVKIEEKLKSKEAGDKTILGNKLYYLKKQEFEPYGHYNNRMYMIDLTSGEVIKESSFRDICGFKYYVFGDGVVVIGYKNSHKYDHFLVLLDPETVEPKIIGKDNIFWRSFVEFKDNFLYAITIINGKYYLGKFNRNLEKVGVSDIEVDPDSFITFYEGKIFINDKYKNIVVLDESNLKKISQINIR